LRPTGGDHPGHPTSGGLYRAAAASYSDRDAGVNSFRRYEIEASQFVPLFAKKWVLGKVAPRAGDLDFKDLKTSYGAGLRVVHGVGE
jgi:hypothetical protein